MAGPCEYGNEPSGSIKWGTSFLYGTSRIMDRSANHLMAMLSA
jgi:hypothetical protein